MTDVDCSSWLRRGYRLFMKSVRRDVGMYSEVGHDDKK